MNVYVMLAGLLIVVALVALRVRTSRRWRQDEIEARKPWFPAEPMAGRTYPSCADWRDEEWAAIERRLT